jgi:hypothetical protein
LVIKRTPWNLQNAVETAGYSGSPSNIDLKNSGIICLRGMLIGERHGIIYRGGKDLCQNMNASVLGRIICSVTRDQFKVQSRILSKEIPCADQNQQKQYSIS